MRKLPQYDRTCCEAQSRLTESIPLRVVGATRHPPKRFLHLPCECGTFPQNELPNPLPFNESSLLIL